MNPFVLITGASRGIGAATALLAAGRGFAVGVNYRQDQEAAEAMVRRIVDGGGRAEAFQADVGSEEQVEHMFRAAENRWGALKGLVNNAGILRTQTRVEEMSAERWLEVFRTNALGAFLCAREAVRRMSTRFGGSGGSIVNVSSRASVLGSPGEYVDYAASKGALDTFTLGLAREVAADGIRVNGVRPGFIDTEIHASGGEPGRLERIRSSIPLGRGGQAEEVAHGILWLLSDEASYTTGTFLDISGGR